MALTQSPWFWISCAALPVAWKVAGVVFHRLSMHQTTAMNEVAKLGTARKDGKLSGTAVVAGGSFAGLLAARVLSDHFENVVVVEPDTELEDKRSRVGQWNQAHGYLPIILVVLCRLFPNFEEEATRAGLKVGPQLLDLQYDGRRLLTPEGRISPSVIASRMGLESLIRRLVVRTCPTVRFVQGTVTGVVASPDGSRLASVQLRTADGELNLSLAFFADCSGPACGAARWLPRAHAGWGPFQKDTYDPKISYSSARVPVPPELAAKFEFDRPWSELEWIRLASPSWKSAVARQYFVIRLEDNRMLMGTCDWAADDLGTDSIASFLEYCESMDAAVCEEEPPTALYNAIRAVQAAYPDPDKQPSWTKYKVHGGLHHLRYDTATSMPANFTALGDAVMRVNPIFGQGCAKCAVDVATLDGALRQARVSIDKSRSKSLGEGFSRDMAKTQSMRLRPMFDSTRFADYGIPTTQPMEGETLETGYNLRLYLRGLISLVHEDEDVAAKYWAVLGLVSPGSVLMHPWIIARAMWRAFWCR